MVKHRSVVSCLCYALHVSGRAEGFGFSLRNLSVIFTVLLSGPAHGAAEAPPAVRGVAQPVAGGERVHGGRGCGSRLADGGRGRGDGALQNHV